MPGSGAQRPFTGAALDRASVQRKDADWIAAMIASPARRGVAAGRDQVLVSGAGRGLGLVRLEPTDEQLAVPILLARQSGWTSLGIGLVLALQSAPMVVFSYAGGHLAACHHPRNVTAEEVSSAKRSELSPLSAGEEMPSANGASRAPGGPGTSGPDDAPLAGEAAPSAGEVTESAGTAREADDGGQSA